MQDKASNLIKGETGDWEVIVGMEVHAQVNSKAKLFSGASTEFGGEPNAHVSLVDAAMPGMLPVINEECIAQAVRTGFGLVEVHARLIAGVFILSFLLGFVWTWIGYITRKRA